AVAHLRRGLGLVERLTGAGERASRELDLQVELGISLLATKGFAAPEVGETYRRAERLATEAGQHAKLYAILQGQFHHHAVRGEIGRCLRLAERCHAMARAEGDPVLLLGAHYTLCAGVCWRGEFAAAKAHLEEVLR